MKVSIPLTLTILVLLLLPKISVHSQSHVEYSIQVSGGGSASWTVKQTVPFNESYDSLDDFHIKFEALATAAKNGTGRDMILQPPSMSVEIDNSIYYVFVEYRIVWDGFGDVENASIIIGDVFEIEDFFPQLYGEGKIVITYPSGYVVENPVLPVPSARNDSIHFLEWPGTIGFDMGDVRIVLNEDHSSSGLGDGSAQNLIVFGGVSAVIVGSAAAIYILGRRKRKGGEPQETGGLQDFSRLETDEDRIVKFLKSSGGSSYQTEVTDHFRFSRAKTSQVLSAMEKKGIVRRQKKGRDNIVVLVEERERRNRL